MRHALKIDMLLLKSAKTTLRRQTHKIDTIIARQERSTDSVCVNFFGFTRPAGRTSAYRGSRYRFNDGPKMYQKCTKNVPKNVPIT